LPILMLLGIFIPIVNLIVIYRFYRNLNHISLGIGELGYSPLAWTVFAAFAGIIALPMTQRRINRLCNKYAEKEGVVLSNMTEFDLELAAIVLSVLVVWPLLFYAL